jgi:hypothetical protein
MAMVEDKNEFQVSLEEFVYLNRLAAHDMSVAELLKNHEKGHGESVTLRLTCTEAEELRDSLTLQLAAVGFDKDYSLNEQGRLLENLIDKFYLPKNEKKE